MFHNKWKEYFFMLFRNTINVLGFFSDSLISDIYHNLIGCGIVGYILFSLHYRIPGADTMTGNTGSGLALSFSSTKAAASLPQLAT